MYNFSTRQTSGFPLSIGTGLLFESIFPTTQNVYDKDRVVPGNININRYNYHYISIRTLARNLISAVDNKDLAITDVQGGIDTILEEMDVIARMYMEYAKNTTPVFYNNMLKFSIDTKKAVLRIPTPKSMKYVNFIDKVTEMIVEHAISTRSIIPDYIHVDDYTTRPNLLKSGNTSRKSILLTTSNIHDIFSFTDSSTLHLLESYTGKLKSKYEWSSKYHPLGKKDLSFIPFKKELLYFLGDKNVFRPASITLRRELIAIAEAKRWTSHTSEAIFKSHIRRANVDLYKRIYK